MERDSSTSRRAYLAVAGSVGTTALAGCLGNVLGSSESERTYLEAPDRPADPDDLAYPAFGQTLPEATLSAPLYEEDVAVGQFETDTFLTFFYSHCNTVCPRLISTLRNIQTRAAEDGHGDDVTFLAVTFDPQRDTASRLETYAAEMNVDLEAGNWYFLRPDSASRARTVVQERFGVGFQRTTPQEMDRYMFTHLGLIVLANEDDVVERAYATTQPAWQSIYDDFETLREREG